MIGPAIRAMRHARGMTQRQVADRCGIRHPHLSALERGHTRPTLDTITRIADALDCDAAVTLTPRPDATH